MDTVRDDGLRNFLPLSRKIFQHPYYREKRSFSKFEALLSLIHLARWDVEAARDILDGKSVTWGRGELPASVRFLGAAWQWDKNKVARFLSTLEEDGTITRRSENGITILRLVKYEEYNRSNPLWDSVSKKQPKNGTANETANETLKAAPVLVLPEIAGQQTGQQTGQRRDSDKDKTNIVNKGKDRVYIPPTIDEVILYFRQRGYTEKSARRAFDYYSSAGWKDSFGKQVKNWKQKMIGVWFKPENEERTDTQNVVPAIPDRKNYFNEVEYNQALALFNRSQSAKP